MKNNFQNKYYRLNYSHSLQYNTIKLSLNDICEKITKELK